MKERRQSVTPSTIALSAYPHSIALACTHPPTTTPPHTHIHTPHIHLVTQSCTDVISVHTRHAHTRTTLIISAHHHIIPVLLTSLFLDFIKCTILVTSEPLSRQLRLTPNARQCVSHCCSTCSTDQSTRALFVGTSGRGVSCVQTETEYRTVRASKSDQFKLLQLVVPLQDYY
jgi:hypothetical protein